MTNRKNTHTPPWPHSPVLLIGPRASAGNVTGNSAAFELLISAMERNNIRHTAIDLLPFGHRKTCGTMSTKRAVEAVWVTLKVWAAIPKHKHVYLVAATSRMGALRDALLIIPSWLVRRRIVLHLHGGGHKQFYLSQPGPVQALLRFLLQMPSKIIVLADQLKDEYLVAGVSENDIAIVPNGLPIGAKVGDMPKNLSKPFQILFLSNIMVSKGILDLIEACRILAKNDFEFECHLCGSIMSADIEEARLTEAFLLDLISSSGLSRHVFFQGMVKGDKKAAILSDAHALVLPTYYPWEGQPLCIIEALATATPVISTYHKGIPDQIQHSANGFLVAPRSPDEIADAILTLSENEERYRNMSSAALAKYHCTFTARKHLERIIPILLDTSPLSPIDV